MMKRRRPLAVLFRRRRRATPAPSPSVASVPTGVDAPAGRSPTRRQVFTGAAGAALGGAAIAAETALRPLPAGAQTGTSANGSVTQQTVEGVAQAVVPPGGPAGASGRVIPGVGFANEHDTGWQNARTGSNGEVNLIVGGKRGLTFFEDDVGGVVGISGTGTNRVVFASEQAGLNFFAKSGHIEWEGQDGPVISVTGYQLSTARGKPIRFTTDPVDTPACPLQAQSERGVNAVEWYDHNGVLQGALTEGGDVEVFAADRGMILHSPNGTRWRATMSNDGKWVTAKVTAAPAAAAGAKAPDQAAPPISVPGAVKVGDTFERANSDHGLGKADTGQPWTEEAGGWGIDANRAYCAHHVGFDVAIVDSSVSDCTVGVDLPVAGGGGLAFRYIDRDNCFLVVNGGQSIVRWVRGSMTMVAGYFPPGSDGDHVEVALNGSSITLRRNGKTITSLSDPTHQTATKHGLANISNTRARFDKFFVAV